MSQLTREQKLAVNDRGGALLVSAAAGSGKTRVLVERLFSYVTGPQKRDMDEFLIITYTRAAADELRAKIMAELSRRLRETPDDAHLQKQSVLVYRAQISTIHTFCGELIRDRAHLLGLSPDFRIMDEDEASLLLDSVLDELMERSYREPDEDFLQLVDVLGAGRDDKKLCGVVTETYRKLRSHPEPEVWGKECVEKLAGAAHGGENCWCAQILYDVADTAGYWARRLTGALEEMESYPDMYAAYGKCFFANIFALAEIADAAETGKWDEVQGKFPVNFGRLGTLKNFEYPQLQERMKTIRDLAKKSMSELEKLIDCSYAQACEDIDASTSAVRGLMRLVRELDMDFTQMKLSRSAADFSDLEHYALQLLCPNGVRTELADKIASRYCEVMVDEYQDTNVIQNLIFSAVSRGRLFSVGDVKQSIYRFNLADPTIFLNKYTEYLPAEKAEEGQPRKIVLSDNFRSRPEITDFVNFVFTNIMSTKFGELDYGEEEMLRSSGTFPQVGDMPAELDIVDVGALDEEDELSRSETEAEYVAARVRKLLDSGMQVTGQDGKARRVRPGDIVILMRSPSGKTAEYLRALEMQRVPVSARSTGFFGEWEISVMVSLLEIIDNPHQDVPLIAVLRSPLFGFSDDKLARIRACDKECDFFDALKKFSLQDDEAKRFVTELEQIRMKSREMGAEELVRLCFEKMAVLQVFGALPNGDKRKRNLTLLAEQANNYEKRGYRGLFSFITWLRKLRETGREPSAGTPADLDAVQIMSIHRSKGLEFPVVIIADLGKRFNFKDLDRQVLIHTELGIGTKRIDSRRMLQYSTVARSAIRRRLKSELMAEELRLLYVAMTRAKDKLIIIAAAENIEKEMNKLSAHVCSPVAPESMAGFNCMAKWMMLVSLLDGADGVMKINRVMQAEYGRVARESGTEQPRSQAAPPELVELARANLDYIYPYAGAVNTPSKITATALKGRQIDEEVLAGAENIFTKFRRTPRPRFIEETKNLSGSEKGIALHLAMQYICYSKCVTVQGITEELERLYTQEYMTRAQVDAVDPQRIYKLFSSPLGKLLLQSNEVRREFKFSILMPADELKLGNTEDKVLVQGVIDCFVDTPDGLVVVDFKSDKVTQRNVYERAGSYKIQLDTYCTALERITGRPILRRVLYFFALDMEINL